MLFEVRSVFDVDCRIFHNVFKIATEVRDRLLSIERQREIGCLDSCYIKVCLKGVHTSDAMSGIFCGVVVSMEIHVWWGEDKVGEFGLIGKAQERCALPQLFYQDQELNAMDLFGLITKNIPVHI